MAPPKKELLAPVLERIAVALERLVEALEEPDAATAQEVMEPPPITDTVPVLMELPPVPEPPACRRCKHSQDDHEPLSMGHCYAPGCVCKGWRV